MRKLVFEILSKEKIVPVIFFTAFVILVLILSPIQFFNADAKSSPKIESPLSLSAPIPAPTLTPIPTITSTPARKPTRAPTKISLPTSLPTEASAKVGTPDPKSPDNPIVWESIAICEANGNWSENTGNGYFGGLQFSQGAWNSVGGSGNPSQASKDEQINRGKMLQAKRGWGVWGACAAKLGLN